MTSLLSGLNDRQREAVLATEGPVLVLAGAGTGKTRVITYRVAHLIEQGVPPSAILAVTFTNKAAGVMKERIGALLRVSGSNASDVWISTFHSFCARLLRREAHHLGLPRDFAIFDDDDQTAAVKRALLQLGLSTEDYPPRALRAQISHAKNHGMTAEEMLAQAPPGDRSRQDVARVYRAYDEILRKSSALDFDDLLLRSVELLRNHPDVRAAWSRRFRYLMADEFQDTNQAQEELVRLLAGPSKNVCVVGDEDQSIYGWRGARAGNLKRFAEDFPGARIIRLEENYRSTQTILDAAAAVVEHNTNRLGKSLQATLGAGMLLRYFEAPDSVAEAEFVGGEIARLVREQPEARAAVLYRTGAQSRSFEEVLRRLGIRHRVVGGFSFYQRAEVRHALGYLRLLFHPDDDVTLLRVLNVPPRGIGAKTVEALEAHAKKAQKSLWEAIGDGGLDQGQRGLGPLRSFRDMIETLRRECRELSPAALVERVLDVSGLLGWAEQQDNLEHTSRAENLRELSNAMAEAEEQGQTLEEILDRAALVSDADQFDESIPLSLMTLHSAKGLEFDAVFLAGLEEGLLPHSRSLNAAGDIEEERRLFYVGMTRAKKTLVLSRAVYRRIYGEDRLRASLPSRFLAEIPLEMIEAAAGSQAKPGETRRYEPDPDFSEEYDAPRQRSGYGYSGYRRTPPKRSADGRPAGRATPANPLIGTRVRHAKYGVGTIIGVEGEGEDRKLTVSFPGYGAKKLIERYANLQFA